MNEYSRDEIVARYVDDVTSVGLWASEEYIFRKYVNHSKRILDMGCGAGRTTFALHALGYTNIIGLELSQKLTDAAIGHSVSQGFDIPFVCGDAQKMPFSDGSFDICFFSYNGLFTVPGYNNRVAILREIQRVLVPNGLFIFTTYDRNDNEKYIDFWRREKVLWETGHMDKNLYEYGDRFVMFNENEQVFIHCADYWEIISMLNECNMEVLYKERKSMICSPTQREKGKYGECEFYIVIKR